MPPNRPPTRFEKSIAEVIAASVVACVSITAMGTSVFTVYKLGWHLHDRISVFGGVAIMIGIISISIAFSCVVVNVAPYAQRVIDWFKWAITSPLKRG